MGDNLLECQVGASTNIVKIFPAKITQETDVRPKLKRKSPENNQKATGRWTRDEHFAFVRGKISWEGNFN